MTSHHKLLAWFDQDEALLETHHKAIEALDEGDDRRSFLKKAGIGGALMIGSGALFAALAPSGADAAKGGDGRPPEKFGKGDIGILNYALTLEHLEAGFYNEATKLNIAKTPESQAFLKQVTADENAHVAFFSKALGSKALAAPKLDFGSSFESEAGWLKVSMALENTGVAAFAGQALNIASPANVAAAVSVMTVEARHASVVGLLNMPTPSNISPDGAFDKPMSAAEVLKVVEGTGFIV
jgi:hypothetical protein